MYVRTALPEGPRVISARHPGARSVSMAAYVLAGSRLETREQAGVAHFMEHITFKGTAGYPSSRAIAEAIEGVGGSFNAATDRESTVYWVRVPRREMARGMDVLGELVVRPVLADHEIDQERTVIIEEIRSYLDDPVEYAHILFQGAMFGDGPLGREICGDEDSIRGMPRRPSATSGRSSTGRPTRSSPSPATSTTRRPSSSSGEPSARATARSPGMLRPRSCLPASATAWATVTQPRPSWWSVCLPCDGTTRRPGSWGSSTSSWATG